MKHVIMEEHEYVETPSTFGTPKNSTKVDKSHCLYCLQWAWRISPDDECPGQPG